MPTRMYLKLEPIKGDSTDPQHRSEIVVIEWGWGLVTNNQITSAAYSRQTGRPEIQSLILTKWVDVSSPSLMLASCKGQHIMRAILVVTIEDMDRIEEIKITLDDVVVNSVIADKSMGGPRFRENIVLKGAKVAFEYKLSVDGHITTAPPFKWDIERNVTFP